MIDLVSTLEIQTSSYKNGKMLKFIRRRLRDLGVPFYQDKMGNIYATKGQSDMYPCVVAHTDTVHDLVPSVNFKIYREKHILFSIDTRDWSRCGIGGDDKVGVYIALKMLQNTDVCKAAFFVDEEVGCKGSGQADEPFFKDVNVAMQADRKGVREITSSICGMEMFGKKFEDKIADIVEMFNMSEVDGGMTDVMELAEKFRTIPMFNVACGYYQPHTDDEFVNVRDVEDTYEFLRLVEERVRGVDFSEWERPKKVYKYATRTWDAWDDWNEYGGWNSVKGWMKKKEEKTERKKECWKCGSEKLSPGTYPSEYWCLECGEYNWIR
jgi:hypothetical protein